MPSINELKDKINTKTLHLLLLSIATLGIYPILWLYRNTSIIESVTKSKIVNDSFIIWLAACVGIGANLSGAGDEKIEVIAGLSAISSGVFYVVWAFKAKAALQAYALNEQKMDLHMSAFYTFLLNIYYINYCINDLPEAKHKQEILAEVGKPQDS